MAYSGQVMDHYENPRNVGKLDKNDPTVGTGFVSEWVKGKTLEEAGAIKNTQIAEELALPPVKIHCSILAEDAIKSAIADYKEKQAKNELEEYQLQAQELWNDSCTTYRV